MSVPNRRIGQPSSVEALLLHDILKQIERLIQVASAGGGGGSGTVTSVSVVSANGFAGSVATATTTPAITISTSVTGIIKGDGTAISAAVAGTDYLAPNGSGAALTGVYLLASGGTLTGNNTIVQAGFNTTHTGIGRVTFSPTTGGGSVAGLNVGTVAGNPATGTDGDIWHNSASGFFIRNLGTTRLLSYYASGGGTIGRIPICNGTSTGLLVDTANLTFSTNRLLGTVLYLTLSAGTATAGTAPLKLTSGTVLTTPETGSIEYDGTNYFGSVSTTRYTFAKTLTNTATLDFGSTAASSSTDLTMTVTGAADGDPVIVTPPNGSTFANSIYTAWVSAANTITVRFSNLDLVTTRDPASGTFRAVVFKY